MTQAAAAAAARLVLRPQLTQVGCEGCWETRGLGAAIEQLYQHVD